MKQILSTILLFACISAHASIDTIPVKVIVPNMLQIIDTSSLDYNELDQSLSIDNTHKITDFSRYENIMFRNNISDSATFKDFVVIGNNSVLPGKLIEQLTREGRKAKRYHLDSVTNAGATVVNSYRYGGNKYYRIDNTTDYLQWTGKNRYGQFEYAESSATMKYSSETTDTLVEYQTVISTPNPTYTTTFYMDDTATSKYLKKVDYNYTYKLTNINTTLNVAGVGNSQVHVIDDRIITAHMDSLANNLYTLEHRNGLFLVSMGAYSDAGLLTIASKIRPGRAVFVAYNDTAMIDAIRVADAYGHAAFRYKNEVQELTDLLTDYQWDEVVGDTIRNHVSIPFLGRNILLSNFEYIPGPNGIDTLLNLSASSINTIYSADDSLASNRTVTQNQKYLIFTSTEGGTTLQNITTTGGFTISNNNLENNGAYMASDTNLISAALSSIVLRRGTQQGTNTLRGNEINDTYNRMSWLTNELRLSASGVQLKIGGSLGTNTYAVLSNGTTLYYGQVDTNPSDDLTTSTSFSGDVSGVYNNLQLGTGVVGDNELASTSVTPGSYTGANITVNSDGRITAASNGSGSSGVSSITGSSGISVSPTTGSAVASLTGQALSLHNAGVNGFFVKNGSTIHNRSFTSSNGSVNISNADGTGGNVNLNVATNGVGTSEIADGSITSSDLATNSVGPTQLQSTAVSAGSYTSANITVDADGRITSAANGSGGLPSGTNGQFMVNNAGTWVASNVAGDVAGTYNSLQIQSGVVTSTELAAGAVTTSRLNTTGASNQNTYAYYGSAWNMAPRGFQLDAFASGTQSTPTNNFNVSQILINDANFNGAFGRIECEIIIENTDASVDVIGTASISADRGGSTSGTRYFDFNLEHGSDVAIRWYENTFFTYNNAQTQRCNASISYSASITSTTLLKSTFIPRPY